MLWGGWRTAGVEAIVADTEDCHMAGAGAEAVLMQHTLAHGHHEGVVYLGDVAALLADEMVVQRFADYFELTRAAAKV